MIWAMLLVVSVLPLLFKITPETATMNVPPTGGLDHDINNVVESNVMKDVLYSLSLVIVAEYTISDC